MKKSPQFTQILRPKISFENKSGESCNQIPTGPGKVDTSLNKNEWRDTRGQNKLRKHQIFPKIYIYINKKQDNW